MGNKVVDWYRREWPRVAAVQAMALGGASILASRKKQNARALSVMNAMTMCVHQYEEYVDPGYFPGMVNVGIFKSDQPRNYPYNPTSAMCANVFFRWLYVPPMLFPQVKWLGLPPAMLGLIQGVGHSTLMPKLGGAKYPYSPGALTAALLHVPIGLTYIATLRKTAAFLAATGLSPSGVLAAFLVLGVAAPNVILAEKKTSYEFTDRQMGGHDERLRTEATTAALAEGQNFGPPTASCPSPFAARCFPGRIEHQVVRSLSLVLTSQLVE